MREDVDELTVSTELQRHARFVRRARLTVLALVIAYLVAPYGLRAWISPWLPFVAALGLELHFFLSPYLQARRERDADGATPATTPDRGPQPRDLADLGGDQWRQAHALEHAGGAPQLVPTQGLGDEEVRERLENHVDDPEAAFADPEPLEGGERRVPPRAASRRRLLETAAVLVVVGGILFYASRPHGWNAVSSADRARTEAVLSRAAAAVAGHRATVRCDTSGRYVGVVQDADGLAVVGGNRAYLTPSICDTLYQLAFKHRVQSFPRTGRAIAVLAHEAWHLHGVADEGLANCYGFQSGVGVGVRLGLAESQARAMMREQLATNASDAADNPQYLVPATCRNGGPDDLYPGRAAFP